MARECSSSWKVHLGTLEGTLIFFDVAAFDLIGPHADPGVGIIGQTGGTGVTIGLSIPTGPEDVTLLFICENSIQAWAIGRGNWWLEVHAVTAIDVVQVITVLGQELGITGVEAKSISTSLEFGDVILALVVLITRLFVGIEAVLMRAFELLGDHRGGTCEK